MSLSQNILLNFPSSGLGQFIDKAYPLGRFKMGETVPGHLFQFLLGDESVLPDARHATVVYGSVDTGPLTILVRVGAPSALHAPGHTQL